MPVQRRPGVYSRISKIRGHLGECIESKIVLDNALQMVHYLLCLMWISDRTMERCQRYFDHY